MRSLLRCQALYEAQVLIIDPSGVDPLLCGFWSRERRQIGRIPAGCTDRHGKDRTEPVVDSGEDFTLRGERG
jgi:hypothetical protein